MDVRCGLRTILLLLSMATVIWGCFRPAGQARTAFYELALLIPWGVLLASLSVAVSPARVERLLGIAYFGLLTFCAVRFWILPYDALDIAQNMREPLLRQSQFIGCGGVGWLAIRAVVIPVRHKQLAHRVGSSMACLLVGGILYTALVASSGLYLGGGNLTWLNDDYAHWIPEWILGNVGALFIFGLTTILLAIPAALLVCLLYRIPVLRVSAYRKMDAGNCGYLPAGGEPRPRMGHDY